jgi:hypothetical protein
LALHLAPDRAGSPAKQPGNRALTVTPLQKNFNLASFNGGQVSIVLGHEYLPVYAEKIISYLIPTTRGTSMLNGRPDVPSGPKMLSKSLFRRIILNHLMFHQVRKCSLSLCFVALFLTT